jgi:signal transduction histidine kinase
MLIISLAKTYLHHPAWEGEKSVIRELRKKFILINMLLVLLVLAITFSAMCASSYNKAIMENEDALHSAINRMDGQRLPTFYVGQKPPKEFYSSPVFVVFIGRNGDLSVFYSENISVTEESLKEIADEVTGAPNSTGVLSKHNLRFLKRSEPMGLKAAFIDISKEKSALANSMLMSFLYLLASLSAFFVISLFLSKWILKPAELAWQQQKRFVADASHELKTPLTVILANLGILKNSDASEMRVWLDNTEAEAQRMRKLVNSLLFLAKSDDTKKPFEHQVINFSDLALSSALSFETVAFERQISIKANISPDILISGDESQLQQLLAILLDNAVKYSEESKAVTVSLSSKQSKALLSVHNYGSTLDPEDLEHIFERFYRADKSRANEGYGLGLSIAKSIADLHNAKISATSSIEKGTFFQVSIPLVAESKKIAKKGADAQC